jgi:hypothetical protein
VQGDDVQAVVQVAAEDPAADLLLEVPVGRRDDAHVDGDRLRRAHGTTSRSWRTRSSFTCVAGVISPTSSRKKVPPAAATKRPCLSRTAPVKEPLMCPKSSDSRRFSGSAPQLMETNGPPPIRERVDVAGDHLLARSRLAGDQDRRVGGRDGLGELEHLDERRALSDRPRGLVGVAAADLRFSAWFSCFSSRDSRPGGRSPAARRWRTASGCSGRRPG